MAQKDSQLVAGLKDKGIVITETEHTVDPVSLNKDLKEIVDDEKFAEEVLTVYLFPTTDANAPPYAIVSVNGERAVIPRSRPCKVKRKVVEVLARMKETRYSQQESAPGMEQTMDSLRGHTALVYPFSVSHDPNPRGAAWLENILMEPSY